MSEKAPDRRTLKTRKALCDALSELLIQKPLHKVTVQEIADKADVNRVTFYKHYLDVYDLYDKIELAVLLQISGLMLNLESLPPDSFFEHLIAYIDENRTVFRLIFSPNSTGQLQKKFNKLIEGIFRLVASEKQNTTLNSSRLAYQTCYRSSACIAVIERWVCADFQESKDFIVKTLSELDRNTEQFMMQNTK